MYLKSKNTSRAIEDIMAKIKKKMGAPLIPVSINLKNTKANNNRASISTKNKMV